MADPWAEFNPTPAALPSVQQIQQKGNADPWAEFNPTQASPPDQQGNEPSIAARADAPPRNPILEEQRRRFEAMNPQGELTSGGLMPQASTPLLPLVPQPIRDFGKLAFNEASMDAFPTQRAQVPAEKERLGPLASGVAEALGYYASPTTLLNRVPVVGGILAGGLHEGIKSKAEGDDWTTAGKKALIGAGVGGASTGAARVLTSPSILAKATEVAGTGGAATLAHTIFGDSVVAPILAGGMGYRWAQPAAKWVEENSSPLVTALRPYIAAAFQAPSLGAQPQQGWSQWWKGQ